MVLAPAVSTVSTESHAPRRRIVIEDVGYSTYIQIDRDSHPATNAEVYRGVRQVSRAEFTRRANAWRDATMHLSSPARIYSDPSYHWLLILGEGILPFIIDDLRNGADLDWYPALRLLAGPHNDPVADAERGQPELMDAAWLRWWEARGQTA